MTCCRNVSTGGKPKPKPKMTSKNKNGTLGCRSFSPAGGLLGRAHRLQEFLIRQRLARLHHGDRLDLAALHGEDRDLRVLAVALVVEGNRAGRAVEADLLQLRQVFLRI